MTIQNMFNMAKGQTLTQDGCETDVDDKRYNIGDISQKTGLQKTANGWVKPRNGKAPGAKTGPGESPKMGSKEYNKQYGLSKKDVRAGAQVDKIYERQLKRIKELRAKGFTDEQIDNDKIIKQTKEDMKNVGKKPESKPDKVGDFMKAYERGDFGKFQQNAEQRKVASFFNSAKKQGSATGSKPAEKAKGESKPAEKTEKKSALKLPDEKSSFSTDVNRMKKLKKEDYKQYTIQLEKLHSKYPINKWKDLYNKTVQDCAPCVLTKDTKIRVRKA